MQQIQINVIAQSKLNQQIYATLITCKSQLRSITTPSQGGLFNLIKNNYEYVDIYLIVRINLVMKGRL